MRTFAKLYAASLLLFICSFTPRMDAQEASAGEKEAARPHVFPRIQIKYSCFANYLGLWTDRPLLMDRSLRYKTGSFEHCTPESFAREVKMARAYEVDGFSAFINGQALYGAAAAVLSKEDFRDFLLLPQFGVNDLKPASVSKIENGLATALPSANTWKLNGEPVLSSYVFDCIPAELWAPVLEGIRARSPEKLRIVADMGVATGVLTRSNAPNETALEAFRKKLRSYLDICDGIMIGTGDFGKRKPYGYGTSLDETIYAKAVKAMKEVLAEPKYQGKLLGLGAPRGYINPFSGVVHREDGTRRLRHSFEIAMAARPDFIQLAEWNEVNENTCIQPTVAGSFTNQRIIRYYMRQLKGEAPAPNPGDDLSVPNLVLSYRRDLKLGEAIDLEILNIPDADTGETFTAQLSLKDIKGNVFKTFPKQNFVRNEMHAQTVSFASEDMPGCPVFIPSLEVVNAEGESAVFEDGLLGIHLRSTWTTDYLEVHQPLRDLCKPEHASLTLAEQPAADGGIALQGSVACDEELASVEVLEGNKEVYGYDRENEFDLGKNVLIRGEFVSAREIPLTGKFYVRNAGEFHFRPWEYANSGFTDFEVQGDGIAFRQKCNSLLRGFFITIPRANLEDAVLDFQGSSASFSIPVKELVENRLYSRTFSNGLVFSLRHHTALADIPVPVNAKSVNFSCTVFPEQAEPIYHLRLITKSGKIYRSRPIMPLPPSAPDERSIALNVFSEAKGSVVPVAVGARQIPDLNYRFEPARHDLLVPSAGVFWAAELGGGIDYGGPFHASGRFPAQAVNSSPEWVTEDGAQSLEFDGVGNWVVFPAEALPRGPFTLQFEIKPTSNRDEVLFRHQGSLIGSLTVRRSHGKLCASFTDSKVETTPFRTSLDLPVDRWSKVEIRYDLHQIVLQVDDRSESFPFSREALYSAPSSFGGCSAPGFGVEKGDAFFKGYLKSFRIVHHAASMKNEASH